MKDTPDRPILVDKGAKELALVSLKSIVEGFNETFSEWTKTFGCNVTFTWGYKDCKRLEIASVDAPIYRKPPPGEATMKAILGQNPPE